MTETQPIAAADPAWVIDIARSWLGTPYHDQASIKGVGCDCAGLARGIWREIVGEEPARLPAYSRDWGEVGARETFASFVRPFLIEIDPASAGPGALLLFRMRREGPAKHCGVLVENCMFIHALERRGVTIFPYDTAWARRTAFAFLFPAGKP
jgi:NlpC/P60 family putative phage cell wall peptidase